MAVLTRMPGEVLAGAEVIMAAPEGPLPQIIQMDGLSAVAADLPILGELQQVQPPKAKEVETEESLSPIN